MTERVVSAVAEATDSDPLSIEPLYTAIDPDALTALFEPDGSGGDRAPDRVVFSYCGCEVVISADGAVHVTRTEQETRERDFEQHR